MSLCPRLPGFSRGILPASQSMRGQIWLSHIVLCIHCLPCLSWDWQQVELLCLRNQVLHTIVDGKDVEDGAWKYDLTSN